MVKGKLLTAISLATGLLCAGSAANADNNVADTQAARPPRSTSSSAPAATATPSPGRRAPSA
jgi:hypothetical protein